MTAPRRPLPGARGHDPMLEMVLGAVAHADRAARSVRALAGSARTEVEGLGLAPDALIDMALGVVAFADALGEQVRAWGKADAAGGPERDRDPSTEVPPPAELLR